MHGGHLQCIYLNKCLPSQYLIITLIGLHLPLTVTRSISLALEYTMHDSIEDLDLWLRHGQNPALQERLPCCSRTILSEPVGSVGMAVSAHLNCPLFSCLSTPTAPPLCSSSSSSLLSRGCQSKGVWMPVLGNVRANHSFMGGTRRKLAQAHFSYLKRFLRKEILGYFDVGHTLSPSLL